MSSASYQRLPTRSPSPPSSILLQDEEDATSYPPHFEQLSQELKNDPRFNPTPPHWTHRALLIAFVIFIHWFAYYMLPIGTKPVEFKDDES